MSKDGFAVIEGFIDDDNYLNVTWDMTDDQVDEMVKSRRLNFRLNLSPKRAVKVCFDVEHNEKD